MVVSADYVRYLTYQEVQEHEEFVNFQQDHSHMMYPPVNITSLIIVVSIYTPTIQVQLVDPPGDDELCICLQQQYSIFLLTSDICTVCIDYVQIHQIRKVTFVNQS